MSMCFFTIVFVEAGREGCNTKKNPLGNLDLMRPGFAEGLMGCQGHRPTASKENNLAVTNLARLRCSVRCRRTAVCRLAGEIRWNHLDRKDITVRLRGIQQAHPFTRTGKGYPILAPSSQSPESESPCSRFPCSREIRWFHPRSLRTSRTDDRPP